MTDPKTPDLIRTEISQLGTRVITVRDSAAVLMARDNAESAQRCIDGAREYIAGEHDDTYTGPWGPYTDLHGFREHFAYDCLRDATHWIVWAEYYAGQRDLVSTYAEDPHRNSER